MKKILAAILICFLAVYVLSAHHYKNLCSQSRQSCLEHRRAGCNIDGEYLVNDSKVSCDMSTENGGWTLIANYMHEKSHSGQAQVLGAKIFPLTNHEALGADEFETPAWGQVSLLTLSSFTFHEIRFRCQTTSHPGLLDFVITSEDCINYFRSGKGSCVSTLSSIKELAKTTRSLPGNTAQLPLSAESGYKDQGEFAFDNYPFYLPYKNHWSVKQGWGRFECDDYNPKDIYDTWHQVWVR